MLAMDIVFPTNGVGLGTVMPAAEHRRPPLMARDASSMMRRVCALAKRGCTAARYIDGAAKQAFTALFDSFIVDPL
jgi:hypothetical protein